MSLSHNADGPHLNLAGRLDAQNAADLRAALARHAAATPGDLSVDLSGVPFMDSSALAALVGALKDRRREGRTLRLSGASPAVRELLSLTMLDRAFALPPDGASR
ncbi:STAS domain-containing protein [Deinococcus depolymerans]|uniref:Anti-sigma factor antagonist n=1 Tax=Deinococcus depolymerans TaxID=392408 RepID=A0ABN1BP61_9DEIO